MKQQFINLGASLVFGTIYANAMLVCIGTTIYIQDKIWTKMRVLEKYNTK
jgi:hypothetical protein